jgi:hypothetical protein
MHKKKTTGKDTKGGKKRSDKNLCAPLCSLWLNFFKFGYFRGTWKQYTFLFRVFSRLSRFNFLNVTLLALCRGYLKKSSERLY